MQQARGVVVLLFVLSLPSVTCAQSFGNLDTKFVLRVHLFAEGNLLGLAADVSSTTVYPCLGFGIRFSQRITGDTVSLTIGGLVRPTRCHQALDVASGKVFIGPLVTGKYVLRISYREREDLYLVSVRSGQYSIIPRNNTFTEIERL